jgi:N-succinyldiaminopimelate aminotransferase
VPRFPRLSASADAIPVSIFARLVEVVEGYHGDVIPFHIGDTHLPPPVVSRLGSLGFSADNDPELYRYAKAHGDLVLLHGLVDKLRSKNAMDFVHDENVQITSGATHALSCAVRATFNPGDEILLLAPFWPLIRGISLSAGVRPVEVACGREQLAERSLSDIISEHITEKTAGIYLSCPNNPDGKVFTAEELTEIGKVAIENDLWVISDEVYEDFIFDGLHHRSFATMPGMAERTMTAFSFSKSFALAGLRVGYLVGPAPAMLAARRMVGHTIYSVPRAMQRAALAALKNGDDFLRAARDTYQEARDFAMDRVIAPCHKPLGCTYLFLDLRAWVEADQGCIGVLEKIAEAGVLLAPGRAFGHDYAGWARLCFTSVPRETLIEGIDRVNDVLAKLPTR